MAAIDPAGSEKYWFNGLPFQGLKLTGEGTERYWSGGLPLDYLYPTAAGLSIPVAMHHYKQAGGL